MIDKAAINSVIWYADTLEAWRSDKFTGFVKQPENTGVVMGQNGYWGLYGATPVSADTSAPTTAGCPAGRSAGQVAIVVIGAIILLARVAAPRGRPRVSRERGLR